MKTTDNLPPGFAYRTGTLHLEDVNLAELAREVGTPAFVYSAGVLRRNYREYTTAFREAGLDLSLCYAVKACSNLSVIRTLAELGAGADVVSGGELYRATRAGVPPSKIVFAGVGKTAAEIRQALDAGIMAFNIESEAELDLLEKLAGEAGKVAGVSIRVNPDVDAHTHHYITTGRQRNKFGLPVADAARLARRIIASPALKLRGLQSHIGSQLLKVEPLVEAMRVIAGLAIELERETGVGLEYLDAGGGLGVAYRLGEEKTASPAELAQGLAGLFKELGRSWPLLAEPGRWMVANAGVLLTRVLYLKEHQAEDSTRFAIVDAAMNDLLRPSLYQAYHEIIPVTPETNTAEFSYEVVGPVCESGDFFAHDRTLPQVKQDDLLALLGAGAYGFSMASNYNSRGRAAEILVDGANWRVARRRENYEDLVRGEE